MLMLMLVVLPVAVVDAELVVPKLRRRQFPFSRVREADINVGLIASVHQPGASTRCTDLIPDGPLRPLAMQFAIEQINARQDLLPNITLGFVQMDDCYDKLKALEVSIYFVKDTCDAGGSGTNCSSTLTTPSGVDVAHGFVSHDVVGVIGPYSSPIATMIAPYLA